MTIAVVGLGAMGSRVAGRLLGAGQDVVVWNRTPAKTHPLVAAGARAAATPAEAAAHAAAVVTMVADPRALEAVTEGPDGVAAGIGPGATLVEMSTVGVPALERLRAALAGDESLLDAPVLGSVAEAEAGRLTIFAGGPEDALDRCRPWLASLGSVVHVGALGRGAAAKLVANGTLFGILGVLGEGLALAEGLGFSRRDALEILAATPVGAQVERRRPSLESGEYPRRFALDLALKDAELVAAAAEAAGVELRLAAAARAWLADATARGWGQRDYSVVLEQITDPVRRNS